MKYFAKDVSVSLERHSFAIDKLLYGVNDKISRYKHGNYHIRLVTSVFNALFVLDKSIVFPLYRNKCNWQSVTCI